MVGTIALNAPAFLPPVVVLSIPTSAYTKQATELARNAMAKGREGNIEMNAGRGCGGGDFFP
jgi:hypothetical protein